MIQNKNEVLCALPFIHMNTTTGGLYKACCIMNDPLKDDFDKPITLYNHSLDEAWNSNELKTIRKQMLAGEKPAQCKKCYYEESHGGSSLRKDYTSAWFESNKNEMQKRTQSAASNDGHLKEKPLFIELKFGNLCNIKCRMCSPFDSSQVKKEYSEIAKENKEFDGLWGHRDLVLYNPEMKLDDLPIWYENDKTLNQFLDLTSDLKKLHFAGGEPTLHIQFNKFLDNAIKLGSAKNIELSFNTNLTNLSDTLIEKLKQFKNVVIHASIDGINNIQEYIRHPSKWSTVSQNLIRLMQTPESIKVIVSPTLQIYNLFELIDLFKYIDQLNEKYNKNVYVTPGVLDNPNYFNVRILPLAVRQEAAKKWREYANLNSKVWIKDRLNTIANIIESKEILSDNKLIQNFIVVTNALDKKRNQNFSELYPFLSEKINNLVSLDSEKLVKKEKVDTELLLDISSETVRFIKDNQYSDYNPESIISKNLNQFKNWNCSVGKNGLFIDWKGYVFAGTCLMNPEDSYGQIEQGFTLKNEWVKCKENTCVCNIEITLPKFKNSSENSEVNSFNSELASQIELENLQSAAIKIVSPDVVLPAKNWDRSSKYVMWAIGRRCNYSCSYCDDSAHSKTDPFFSRETLFNTIDILNKNYAKNKKIRYAFTGGEPTLHPDFMDLVKAIHAQGHFVGITSNGSRNSEYYSEILRYATINFSVHFEFFNEDRFVKLIEKIIEAKKNDIELLNRWVDIRFMIKPGGYEKAKRLLNKLQLLNGFDELIFYSFVPVRSPNTKNMMNYSDEEMAQIEKEMLS